MSKDLKQRVEELERRVDALEGDEDEDEDETDEPDEDEDESPAPPANDES